jgi:parallel beta-helix repeat protein
MAERITHVFSCPDVFSRLAGRQGAALVGVAFSGSGASARAVNAKLYDFLSIKDFGAVGDGTTNDSTAFTNAVAAARGAGKLLWLPGGTYLVDPVAFGASFKGIVGEGIYASVLKFRRVAYSPGTILLNATSTTGLLLRDFCVDADDAVFRTAGVYSIVLNATIAASVESVRIVGRGAAGVYGDTMTGNRIDNLLVQATGATNANIDTGFYGVNCNNVVVRGMRTTGTPKYSGLFGATTLYSSFVDCHSEGNGGLGFSFSLGGCMYSAILGCTATNPDYEAFQLTDSSYCVVNGNRASWDNSHGLDAGISVAGSAATPSRHNVISDNVVVNSYACGLLCAEYSDNNLFTCNVVRNCGVRGTAAGASGTNIAAIGQYTTLASASCSDNAYRGNKIASSSGTVTYGFAEFNNGAGATMTGAALTDNAWSGTITTPYLFVSATSYADDGTWRDGSITIAPSAGSITSYSVTTAKFRRRGKGSQFRAVIVITNNGTGSGGLDVFFPTGLAAGTTSGVIMGRNSTSGLAIIGLANGTGVRMFTTAGAYPVTTGDTIVIEGTFENS